jgi:hypothetical protein
MFILIFAQIIFSMPKTILSTALMPNIDYITAIQQADAVEIEFHETFRKQTYRNRYEIAGPNGRQSLTVPVDKGGKSNCPVSDVRISYDENWPKQHWKSLETAYNSSPFFLYYRDDFESILFKKHEFLIDMNMEFTELILNILEIDNKISYTKKFIKNYGDAIDLRYLISPKEPFLKKEYKPYYQVFAEKNGFMENLSAIDLIFNEGKMITL